MSSGMTRQAAQRGSALIVSLVMLLLLTLIGVAGMKDTLLQEKMVGNVRDREIALQAAESALRAAEASLGLPTALNITNNNGLYNLSPPVKAGDPPLSNATVRTKAETEFWRDWAWTAATSVEYPRTLDGVLQPPRYVIEKLDVSLSSREGYPGGGCIGVCAEDQFEVASSADVSDYRITARAVGSTPDAVVILQATFRRDGE